MRRELATQRPTQYTVNLLLDKQEADTLEAVAFALNVSRETAMRRGLSLLALSGECFFGQMKLTSHTLRVPGRG